MNGTFSASTLRAHSTSTIRTSRSPIWSRSTDSTAKFRTTTTASATPTSSPKKPTAVRCRTTFGNSCVAVERAHCPRKTDAICVILSWPNNGLEELGKSLDQVAGRQYGTGGHTPSHFTIHGDHQASVSRADTEIERQSRRCCGEHAKPERQVPMRLSGWDSVWTSTRPGTPSSSTTTRHDASPSLPKLDGRSRRQEAACTVANPLPRRGTIRADSWELGRTRPWLQHEHERRLVARSPSPSSR